MTRSLALLLLFGGVAAAQPTTTSHSIMLKRSVFDLVGTATDVRTLCAGQQPLSVQFQRTAADLATAVFTGMWYTPAHLRVTCATH